MSIVTCDKIKVAGTNYLSYKEQAQEAKAKPNKTSYHAFLMCAAQERSNLNQYRVFLRADLHNADTKSQLAAESIEAIDWTSKTGRQWEKYDAYCKQVYQITTLLELVEDYLEGKEPEKPTTEEYIKVAYNGIQFFCQRFEMPRDAQPTDDDKAVGGYAKFNQPSVTKLVASLRASGKLQPVYIRHSKGFRKVG